MREEREFMQELERKAMEHFCNVVSELPELQQEILWSSLEGETIEHIADEYGLDEVFVWAQREYACDYLRKNLRDGLTLVMAMEWP